VQGRFAGPLSRLHQVGSRRLADSVGTYIEAGLVPVCGIPLQTDQGVLVNGPEGVMRSNQTAIGWKASDLPKVALRVGIFEVNGQRLLIEDIIEDDGHFIVAACMVTK